MGFDLSKDISEMIKRKNYVEVSGIYIRPERMRQIAFDEELWMFQSTDVDSVILWDGKGVDPREGLMQYVKLFDSFKRPCWEIEKSIESYMKQNPLEIIKHIKEFDGKILIVFEGKGEKRE